MNAQSPAPLRLAAMGERLLRQLDSVAPGAAAANDLSLPADPDLLEAQVQRIATDAIGVDRALLDLRDAFTLSVPEIIAAALAFRLETDPYFAHQIARFQDPVGRARLLTGFLATAMGLGSEGLLALAGGPAVDAGLLEVEAADTVLCERGLFMPQSVAAALAGQRQLAPHTSPLEESAIRFSESQQADRALLAAWTGETGTGLVHLASAEPEEALGFATQLAKAAGLEPFLIDPNTPPPAAWLTLRRALPVVMLELGVGESWTVPATLCAHGVLCTVTGLDGKIASSRPIRRWRAQTLDRNERQAVWQGWGLDHPQSASLAARYRQGAGALARAASALAAGDGTDMLAHTNPTLDRLAQRCNHKAVPDEALVAPMALLASLRQLENRILLREGLADDLGPALAARYLPGVRALFCGESGTGKTLAAFWLADRLGLPLYRVDMAALSSKWIGETEKNLSQLLASAETSDAILFFDEADSLFGARTDVGDSNDRHANAQTNFLLQRIEEFDGIAVLTTNSRDRFDSAFVRRLDTILEFPLPDADARRRLWQAHLGDAHALAPAAIDTLARDIDFAGGHIRNVVLAAAALAGTEGRRITADDVLSAVATEFAKLGRSMPTIELAG